MSTCKICSAPRDPLHSICKFCGTAYETTSLTGETYITALSNVLSRIDKNQTGVLQAISLVTNQDGKAKASAISMFAMPSDLESLLQFLTFCHGNAQVSVPFGDKSADIIRGAWNGKARMAFSQLKVKAISNPALSPYIDEYEKLYGVKARKPFSDTAKTLAVLLSGLVVLGALIGFMANREGNDEAKEKRRLDEAIAMVKREVAAGQYDAADATISDIHWTWKPNLLSSQKLAESYDQQREELKSAVMHARSRSNKR